MKTIKILVICMFASFVVTAQNLPPFALEDVEVVPPEFTLQYTADSEYSINSYISKNFVYPEITRLPHEGTEVVKFAIKSNGELSDIHVINSVSPAIDTEIIRILKTTKHMWVPGKHNGEPTTMEKEIAIQVKASHSEWLNNDRDFTAIATRHFSKGAQKLLVQRKTRQALGQFKDALRYKPYDQGLLKMLALCEIELGHTELADAYLSRIEEINDGQFRSELLTENIQNSAIYKELELLLASN